MGKSSKRAKTGICLKPLNWQAFNFTENLLAFCPHPVRMVYPENGIHFRISKPKGDKSLCILFQVDRPYDALIKEGKRPDYLVLHVNGSSCILTIIEMKGERDAKDAICQIATFYDLLRSELQNHLPSKFRFYYQGIILCAHLSQVPVWDIEKEAKRGLPIAVLHHTHRAELYPYISKKNSIDQRYKHEPIRDCEPDGFLETILINGALRSRKEHALYQEYFIKNKERTGMYIDYKHPNISEVMTLISNNREMVMVLDDKSTVLEEKLSHDLSIIGIADRVKLRKIE